MTTLLTGATGFVGGRLLPRLAEIDDVRLIVRDPARLPPAPPSPRPIAVVPGDLGDEAALRHALDGVEVVYYLVHSMEAGVTGFARRDQELARGFCRAAGAAGVRRVVYLGGVLPAGEDEQSEHLRSRLEVERILGQNVEELVGLRASMIVGAQSASFTTLVRLVNRLPVLALPRWRDRRTQPVAIDDVVEALLAARTAQPGIYEIGGPDVVSFEEMARTIATLLGQEKPTIPLPFRAPQLEGAVAAAVSGQERALVTPLMEGLHHDLLARRDDLRDALGVEPTPFADAARAALDEMRQA